MVVRIHFGRGVRVQKRKGKNKRFALAAGALLTPAALMASALGFWRLAADLNMTGEFGITTGIFSHWQVWMILAGLLGWSSWHLNRYGRTPQPEAPGRH
jgi:hypothetical protein